MKPRQVLLKNFEIMITLFIKKKFRKFIYFCPSCRHEFERSTLKYCLDHTIRYQVSRLVKKFNDLAIKLFLFLLTPVRGRLWTEKHFHFLSSKYHLLIIFHFKSICHCHSIFRRNSMIKSCEQICRNYISI